MADETREAVLAAVDELADHGGLSLRPAALSAPLSIQSTDVPHEVGERGPLNIGLGRILIPAGLLALVSMLVLAGVVTLVGFTVGILAAVGVALVGMVGVGAVGTFVVARLARRSMAGIPPAVSAWESTQAWPVALAQSPERRLVFVAVRIVERIVGSAAWTSSYLDEHRIRLDLAAELDEIDEQALRLAQLRLDRPSLARLGLTQPSGDVRRQGWDALVDRVSALSDYADRLEAVETEQAPTTDDATHLLTGSVRDELAADHVRRLTSEITPPESRP